ncbi:hypothetical protein TNCV_5015361 [Trichonephila clavipes]|nr:hypothetical protein TNCV_5015361 [Trichonephila clavipes]
MYLLGPVNKNREVSTTNLSLEKRHSQLEKKSRKNVRQGGKRCRLRSIEVRLYISGPPNVVTENNRAKPHLESVRLGAPRVRRTKLASNFNNLQGDSYTVERRLSERLLSGASNIRTSFFVFVSPLHVLNTNTFPNSAMLNSEAKNDGKTQEDCGLQMLNDDEIVISVQEESDSVEDETDEERRTATKIAGVHQMLTCFLR